jgi:glycerol-3-phosphate cytidylyltransferase-like family protein
MIVDKVVPQESMDKLQAWEKLRFHVMFVGGDWQGTDSWRVIEKQMRNVGVKVVYFPYTDTTSSTIIKDVLSKVVGD